MAVVQVNPPNLATTDEGYISSITIRTGGSPTVLVPSAPGANGGQVTVSTAAATQLIAFSKSAQLITG